MTGEETGRQGSEGVTEEGAGKAGQEGSRGETEEGSNSETEVGSEKESETEVSRITVSKDYYKKESWGNPISPDIFCADPTAIEYNGRLYVFGTNDQQQYDAGGDGSENTYEKIKTLVVYSSEDLVNWTYHGVLDVGKVAPWIYNSWAPSIVSRTEEDGLEHFYMYFSNTGAGVGVITATDPLGPWTDPLGKPLISGKTPGLGECPIPFDPGVCIDDEGRGWLAFGGGKASSGTDYMPGVARIVRLGEDMISLDSEIAKVPAPYFNEASELNYMNGTWVYTYCNTWAERTVWELPDSKAPSICSMVYMTSSDPLNPDSWTYRGEYFANPGKFGLGYGNNHTHLQKYQDRYFLVYHGQIALEKLGKSGGYRNLAIMEMKVDEETQTIENAKGSVYSNYPALGTVNPYEEHPAAFFATTAGIDYVYEGSPFKAVTGVKAGEAGAWTYVRNVAFEENAPKSLELTVKGQGTLEIRSNEIESDPLLKVEVSADDEGTTIKVDEELLQDFTGEQNLYFVLSDEGMELKEWKFVPAN